MLDLAQKVHQALEPCTKNADAPPAANIPKDAEVFGRVPDHLQHLYVLYRQLERAQNDEQHRRCVEFLGKEEYDNERVEFMFYTEVRADPNFGGLYSVKGLFEWALRLHIPDLPTDDFDHPKYFLDADWNVYAVRKGKTRRALPILPLDIIAT